MLPQLSAYLVEEGVELDDDGPDDVEDGEGQGDERRESPEEVGKPGGALPGHLEDHVLQPPFLLREQVRRKRREQAQKTRSHESGNVRASAAPAQARASAARATCHWHWNSW